MGDTGKYLYNIPLVGPTLGGIAGYDPTEEAIKEQEEANARLMSQQAIFNQQAAAQQAEQNRAAMAYQAQLQQEATTQQQDWWTKNAYPSTEATEAMKKQGLAGMSASSSLAQKNFLESASARGILGGGFMSSGLANIERERQKQYGSLLNQLTQYANTPRFAPQGALGISALGTTAGNVGLSGVSGGTQQPDYLSSMLAQAGGVAGGLYGYNYLTQGASLLPYGML